MSTHSPWSFLIRLLRRCHQHSLSHSRISPPILHLHIAPPSVLYALNKACSFPHPAVVPSFASPPYQHLPLAVPSQHHFHSFACLCRHRICASGCSREEFDCCVPHAADFLSGTSTHSPTSLTLSPIPPLNRLLWWLFWPLLLLLHAYALHILFFVLLEG